MFKIPTIGSAFFTSTLNSNSFHVSYCFISGLCCLLPLCLGISSNLECRPLRDALSSGQEFKFSCVASIALVIPLFLDVLFDIGNLVMRVDSQPFKLRGSRTARYNFLNLSERLLILMGIAVQPLVVLVPKNTPNLALIFVCFNKCQQNWVGGTIALSLRRYDKEYFSNTFTITSLASFSFGMIGSTFVDNTYARQPVSNSIAFLDLLVFILTIIPCVSFFFNSLRWLILVYYRASQWSKFLFFYSKTRPAEVTASTDSGDHTYFPMVYTLCGMLVLFLQCVLIGTSSRVENFSTLNLFLSNLPFLVFVTLVSTLSLRMVKFEVVQGLYALIDSKKSYVRYISHELRTPLNAAFLGLKLLTDDLGISKFPIDTNRSEILADVNRACRTTVDILNDLLCFDKMESGILEVHKLMIPVETFVTECVEMFSAQAREGNVTLSVVTGYDNTMPLLENDMVLIDRFKMDQVIRNLISNALKFTPPHGSVTVTVAFVPDCHTPRSSHSHNRSADDQCHHDVSPKDVLKGIKMLSSGIIPYLTRDRSSKICPGGDIEGGGKSSDCHHLDELSVIDGKVVISVKDSGAGMREEEYSRLFKEIVQFRPEILQAGGGSGLGLWITKGIVDLHGGTVSAYSEGPGLGSSFVVELSMQRTVNHMHPSVPATFKRLVAPSILALKADDSVHSSCSCGKGRHQQILDILIVDDSPLNRKMLLRTFIAAGHNCDYAEDGLMAVEKVNYRMASAEGSYSAILMDFVMPNMDGPSATKAIRGLGYTAPIFGLTGNTLSSDVDHFLASGADRVLAKPLNTDAFTSAMSELKYEY